MNGIFPRGLIEPNFRFPVPGQVVEVRVWCWGTSIRIVECYLKFIAISFERYLFKIVRYCILINIFWGLGQKLILFFLVGKN